MRRTTVTAAIGLVAIFAVPAASAQSNTFTVDCGLGQKIATALKLGDWRVPLVINVRGTCREFVNITRADVTLRGDPSAEIVAPSQDRDLVTLSGDRVTLENLTLTGGATGLAHEHAPNFLARSVTVQDSANIGVRVRVGDARLAACTVTRSGGVGISVVRGGSVTLSGSNVIDSAREGINATRNSLVSLTGSTVMRSGTEGIVLGDGAQGSITRSSITLNGAVGIHVGKNAAVNIFKSTISGNGTGSGPQGDGVMLYAGGQGVIEGESVVSDNRDDGIDVAGAASLYSYDSRIAGNGDHGILGYMGANLVLGGLVVDNNAREGVLCAADCSAQMANMEIHGNGSHGIDLAFDSMLMLVEAPIDVEGNGGWGLYCRDAESSVNDTGAVIGTVSGCTGFE